MTLSLASKALSAQKLVLAYKVMGLATCQMEGSGANSLKNGNLPTRAFDIARWHRQLVVDGIAKGATG